MRTESIDAVGIAVGKTAFVSGGAGAFVAGMSADLVAALVGIVVAVVGVLIQLYYNRRRDHREAADRAERRTEHLARMAQLTRRDGE